MISAMQSLHVLLVVLVIVLSVQIAMHLLKSDLSPSEVAFERSQAMRPPTTKAPSPFNLEFETYNGNLCIPNYKVMNVSRFAVEVAFNQDKVLCFRKRPKGGHKKSTQLVRPTGTIESTPNTSFVPLKWMMKDLLRNWSCVWL